MSFPFLYSLNSLQSSLTVYILQSLSAFLQRLQRLKQEWQKSPAGTRQTYGKNYVWFEEIERKLSQIIKDYFHLPFFFLIILWFQPM